MAKKDVKERKAIEKRIRDLSTGNPEDVSKAFSAELRTR